MNKRHRDLCFLVFLVSYGVHAALVVADVFTRPVPPKSEKSGFRGTLLDRSDPTAFHLAYSVLMLSVLIFPMALVKNRAVALNVYEYRMSLHQRMAPSNGAQVNQFPEQP